MQRFEFDADAIRAAIAREQSLLGANLIYKEETGSTNDDCKRLSEEGAPHGTLVVADHQVTGRGSHARGWETPAGANIAMSLLLRPEEIAITRLPLVTLVMGLSLAEAVEELLAAETSLRDGVAGPFSASQRSIKWPNDIVLDGRKISGTLTELHLNPDGSVLDVIVGTGINVNQTQFPEEIRNVAGSLLNHTGQEQDRARLIALVMKYMQHNYEVFCRTQDLSALKADYEKRLIPLGTDVRVLDPNQKQEPYTARCEGITELGELIVTTKEGVRKQLRAGELSIRGVSEEHYI